MVQLGKVAVPSKQASWLSLLQDATLVHDHHLVTGHHALQTMCHLHNMSYVMLMSDKPYLIGLQLSHPCHQLFVKRIYPRSGHWHSRTMCKLSISKSPQS